MSITAPLANSLLVKGSVLASLEALLDKLASTGDNHQIVEAHCDKVVPLQRNPSKVGYDSYRFINFTMKLILNGLGLKVPSILRMRAEMDISFRLILSIIHPRLTSGGYGMHYAN